MRLIVLLVGLLLGFDLCLVLLCNCFFLLNIIVGSVGGFCCIIPRLVGLVRAF
jgi:hypothetical protein